jgi:hypothetical protein
MGVIKNFSDFVKETETLGSDEIKATKPTALSEALCEKLKKCMEMAMSECNEYHNDESKDHTAEGYLSDCDSYMKECYEELKSSCEGLMNTPGAPDGDMRQGNTQDLN